MSPLGRIDALATAGGDVRCLRAAAVAHCWIDGSSPMARVLVRRQLGVLNERDFETGLGRPSSGAKVERERPVVRGQPVAFFVGALRLAD
jgi:hypothetical protein